VNTVTASFNTIMGQMTDISQRKKAQNSKGHLHSSYLQDCWQAGRLDWVWFPANCSSCVFYSAQCWMSAPHWQRSQL